MRSANPVLPPHRRVQLGSFLNQEQTEIRSSNHATTLIGLLELGRGHPDGINGAFGCNNRLSWFWSNINALFCEDGPLGSYVLLLTMFWFVMWGERNCSPNPFMITITLTSSPVLLTRMCPNGLNVFSNFFRPRRIRLLIMQWQKKQGMSGDQSCLV